MKPSLIIVNLLGEILELVEVAATLAIIEGCVKGIEKEGKADSGFSAKSTLSHWVSCANFGEV